MPLIRLNSHAVHLVCSVAKLYENSELTDCVLDTKGGFICAHKTILAACSPYIKMLLMNHGEMRIFSFKEVEHNIMKLILDIVYYGEVEVPSSDMALFIQTAKLLQITSLRCVPPNIPEAFSTTNSGEGGVGNSTTSCGVNLLKNDGRILPTLENRVNCNQDLLHEREDRSNSGFENFAQQSIHSSETKARNILKEISEIVNKDHPMGGIPNSKEVMVVIECGDAANLQDELNPISFVAVPSVSVKSEDVFDEQSPSCISDLQLRNPLEECPYNNDMTNKVNVKGKQEFPPESQVNVENKEVIADNETMKGQSSSINVPFTYEMKQSFNELSTTVVGNMLTHTEPTRLSLFGCQRDVNHGLDSTCISKYKLKEARVVLTRIRPLNAKDKDSENSASKRSLCSSGTEEEKQFNVISEDNETRSSVECFTVLNPVENYKINHSGSEWKQFSSNVYEEVFDESPSLEQHTLIQNNDKPISRSTCGEHFTKKVNFEEHACTNTVRKSYVCGVSEALLSSKGNLRRHLQKNLPGNNPYSCVLCGASFAIKRTLSVHMRSHSKEKFISGKFCDDSLAVKNIIKSHIPSHASKKLFSCNVCVSFFSVESSLKRHMRTHNGEKPFSCKVCKSSFALKANLKIHMRIHTGEKPFSCVLCKASFAQKTILQNHMKTHTGEKPFSCEVCKSSFALKAYLKIHMRIHTGEKPFFCHLCKASFAVKNYLHNHMRIHTGEKPFSCEVCKSSFALKVNLKNHMRIHTKEKPFSCEVCKASFARKWSLTIHKKVHIEERFFSC